MAEFMAQMIIEGKVTYQEAVIDGPMLKYKARVDTYLTTKGRTDLIINVEGA